MEFRVCASDLVRSSLTKYGGNLGESNSVSFQFDQLGQILYPASKASAEAMFEAALEAGAHDVVSHPDHHEIYCKVEELATIREILMAKFEDPQAAKLVWKPKNTISIDGEAAKTLFKLRSEEHTSELQSLMRISYAVFCMKTQKQNKQNKHI